MLKKFVFLALAVVFSSAQADVQDLVAYRQGVMKANAGHLAALKATLVGGQKQFLPQALVHAEAIAKLAGTLPQMFPENSSHPKSDALPAIWRDWKDFTAKAKNMERLANALVQSAKVNDEAAMASAFKKLGKEGCSACHEKYRKD